jgi:2-methylisocitrate lyase-like PEP mutase family enzyme
VTVRGLSSRSTAERRAALRARLQSPELVVAPGVFDMVSARIADRQGFGALYMTGYGAVASYLGYPDAGLATYTDMANRVAQFAAITDTPMVCDGDTGYGGLLNVMHTVRGYEAAGACAIQLEDQEAPKKCGHMLGRRVIDTEDMVAKVRVAVETRTDPNFLVIARTDARTSLGLDEALRRAESYARAGADLLFVEGPESEQELERIGRAFDLPLVVNLVAGGRTPSSVRAAPGAGIPHGAVPGGVAAGRGECGGVRVRDAQVRRLAHGRRHPELRLQGLLAIDGVRLDR